MTEPSAPPHPSWPAIAFARCHRAADRAGLALRGDRGDHPRRADPGLDRRAADPARRVPRGRAHGGKTFLVYEDDRATFEGFARAVLALAADLIRDGLKPGDRVAIAMRNLPEWPVAFFATLLARASTTPLTRGGPGRNSITA